jgi:ABC-type sugar transport system substrate-binding protein
VQTHPETEFVVGAFNDLLVGVPAALRSVGADTEKVHLVASNLDGVFAEMMANGEAEMDLPNGNGQLSWQLMDVILRQIEGMSSEHSEDIGSYTPWIMTQENMPTSELDEINPVENYK